MSEDERLFVEKFAAVWRAIGQPDTANKFVIVAGGSDEFDSCPKTVLGMPVIEVEATINGLGIAIGTAWDEWDMVPGRFSAEWRGRDDA